MSGDSENIAYLGSRSNIFENFGAKFDFFVIFKNCDISKGDFGKTVGVIEEMKSEMTSSARNPPENVLAKWRKSLKMDRNLYVENFIFKKISKSVETGSIGLNILNFKLLLLWLFK